MTDYRPLTRREQLEYLRAFLQAQKQQLEQEIIEVEEEYKLVLKKEKEECQKSKSNDY